MAFTRREHRIIIIAAVVVALLVADQYLLTPLINEYTQTRQKKEQLQTEWQQTSAALARKNELETQWDRMKKAGLAEDYEKMESSILRYIKDSSLKNDLVLSSIQPQRISASGEIEESEFTVSGNGTIRSITQFLWDLETATLPIKIKNLQLGSSDESAHPMSWQVKISSIYLTQPEEKKGEKKL